MLITKYSTILDINGIKYLLNTFNSSLIELDKDTLSKFDNVNNGEIKSVLTDSEIDLLISEGFLVDNDEDAKRTLDLKMSYHKSKYAATSSIKIDIGITDRCNFACPYCFENENKNTGKYQANSNTYAALFSEVRNYIIERVRRGVHEVQVVWYGGEPTLKLEFISFFNEKILNDAKQFGFKYSNILITNGFSFDSGLIKNLKAQNINYVQVTVDGLKETHNNRRNTIPKTDSFETIIKNIDLLLTNNIEVVIRINIDASNYSEINLLLDYLCTISNKDYIGRQLFVSFGRVFGSDKSLSHIKYEDIFHDLYIKAASLGFIRPNFDESNVRAFCSAETSNDNLVIDFLGNKYKCWNDIFHESLVTGSIFESNLKEGQGEVETFFLETLSLDNVNNGKCLDCSFIKYCGGLCPYSRKLLFEGKEENLYENDLCKEIVKRRLATQIEAYLVETANVN